MLNFDFLSRLSKKEKILGFVSLVLVLFVLGDNLLFLPIKNSINKITRDISISKKKIEKNRRILELKETVTAAFANYQSFIKKSLSDEEEIAVFLKTIEVISRQSDISLVDMKPHISREGSSAFYKKYIIEAEIEGSIDKAATFLYNLDINPQLLKVEKLSLKKKGETGSKMINGYLTITKMLILRDAD